MQILNLISKIRSDELPGTDVENKMFNFQEKQMKTPVSLWNINISVLLSSSSQTAASESRRTFFKRAQWSKHLTTFNNTKDTKLSYNQVGILN